MKIDKSSWGCSPSMKSLRLSKMMRSISSGAWWQGWPGGIDQSFRAKLLVLAVERLDQAVGIEDQVLAGPDLDHAVFVFHVRAISLIGKPFAAAQELELLVAGIDL